MTEDNGDIAIGKYTPSRAPEGFQQAPAGVGSHYHIGGLSVPTFFRQ